ncbi:helicase and polymerase-containing protein TEBICHI-like [Prunus avium]|uniref:Helicase and polymerase-containing protein TEBICHI-like n=1 Tax=Prunus avium TaxID=42229 RepID=A0A6P5RRS6_PRUAV|nr:helicase and polymerase-containing protein TEBICHI-like [Prunus avium]XP_021805759.1 helicase and polymerase-containing protein TEBICHI-like [Prunus avium]
MLYASVHETPKLTRGSSSFSPGEVFWDDAIQLANGLCAQAAGVISVARCDCKSKEILDEGEQMDKGGDSGPMGKHRKDLDKEVSPLLVKHFDSSCEDKNLDKSVPHHLDAYNLKSVAHVGGEQSESSLIVHRGLRNTMMICCNKSQENQVTFRDQYTDSVNAVITNMKVDLTGKDMTSYSPVDEVVKLTGNHESDEACTPSSFVPLKGHLDLNSWQRPEICSLYRKKGISKLHPWQVDYLQVEGVLQIRNLVYCASTRHNIWTYFLNHLVSVFVVSMETKVVEHFPKILL